MLTQRPPWRIYTELSLRGRIIDSHKAIQSHLSFQGVVKRRSNPLYIIIDCHESLRDSRNDEKCLTLSLRDFALAKSWQSIIYFLFCLDCFGDSIESPRNDERVGRLYFLRKQNEAKTFDSVALRANFILFGYFATLRFAQYDEKLNLHLICSRFATRITIEVMAVVLCVILARNERDRTWAFIERNFVAEITQMITKDTN